MEGDTLPKLNIFWCLFSEKCQKRWKSKTERERKGEERERKGAFPIALSVNWGITRREQCDAIRNEMI